MYNILMNFLPIILLVLSSFWGLSQAQLSSQQFLLPTSEGTEAKSTIALTPIYTDSEIDSNYIIGPGDFFEILAGEKTVTVQVSIEGAVSLERVGIIYVNKMTLAAAKRAIIEKLSIRYNPEHVFVQLLQTKALTVSSTGSINSPGLLHLPAHSRLSSLIRISGGLTGNADEHNLKLIRQGDTINLNYYAVEYLGDVEQNIRLEQGDVLFVPFIDYENNIIKITMNSHKWNIPWHEGMTVLEALKQSGAIRSAHNIDMVTIISKNSEKKFEYLKALNETVESGYTIELSSGEDEFVYVGGSIAAPGRRPYSEGHTILDYVSMAGVVPISGKFKHTRVIRNGKKIKLDPYNDPVLPGDYIEVSKETFESTKELVSFFSQVVGVLISAVTFYLLLAKE